MTKTTSVLEIDLATRIQHQGAVPFVHPEERSHELLLDREVWNDLGNPFKITITIEPGDTLNV